MRPVLHILFSLALAVALAAPAARGDGPTPPGFDPRRAQADTLGGPAPVPPDSARPETAPADTTAVPADTTVVPADTTIAPADTTIAPADTSTVTAIDSVTAPVDSTLLLNSAGTVTPDQWFVLTARVDTSNADVRDIMRAWRAYMLARYEGTDGAWLWSANDTRRWAAFNLFAPFVFNAPDFFGSRRATVLSCEPAGERYCVRTMFDERSSDGTTSRLDPWAIVRVFFEKADGQWWIRNALPIVTEDWMRSRVRFVEFVYPHSHRFNLQRAMRAVAFCDSITEEFPFLSARPFGMYITSSPEAVDDLLGMDYIASGSHHTVAMPGRGVLITSSDSEWNPRGMLQMLMRDYMGPHPVVNFGFTGWVGGWSGVSYREGMRAVAKYVSEHPDVQFDDLIRIRSTSGPEWRRSAPGAVLCDIVWARGGNDAIFTLFSCGPTDEGLYAAIEKILGVDRDQFQFMWRARVRELR